MASDTELLSRLAGLQAAYSTRFGAALRYAQRLLDNEHTAEREIILLGDGEASDIDSADPRYLHEDAEEAQREVRRSRIDFRLISSIG